MFTSTNHNNHEHLLGVTYNDEWTALYGTNGWIGINGAVDANWTYSDNSAVVRPCLYLVSDAMLEDDNATGTEADPYIILE